jgi:hypothetical protein
MRLNINLATNKYEDTGQFYVRWGSALALAVIIAAVMAVLSWSNYRSTADDRKRINELHRKIAAVEEERRQDEAVLNRPENQDVRDQSGFWNDVIDQKSFSWIQLFSDLEKIMPGRAYVMSVQPELTPDKRLKLRLTIGGEKHENALELVRKMEGSERFRSPLIVSEDVRSQQNSSAVVIFIIETYYTPASPLQPRIVAEKDGKG